MHRFLRVTAEQAYGVYDTTTPAFQYYDPQDGPNAFKPLSVRPQWRIMDPASNVPRVQGSEVYSVAGNWTGRFYWSNYKLAFLPLRVNTGQTSPWPTDCRPGDLASVTCDYGYSYYDLSIKRMRYLGCKLGQQWEISAGNDPANPHLRFNYPLIGSKPIPNTITADTALTDVEFPAPAQSDLPTVPITFYESVFTSQGAAIPYFDRFSIRGQQMAKPYFDNSRFANRISHNGRVVTLTAHLRLDAANDPRTRYEARTALGDTTIVFTKSGAANTLTFNFRSKSYLDSLDEEMPMDDDAYDTITATAFIDSVAGDDFTITYA